MRKAHGLLIALTLGAAAIAGTFAALQTTELGAAATPATAQDVVARERALDKTAAQIRAASKRRPPTLPAVPARSSRTLLASSSGPSANSGPGSVSRGDDDAFDDDELGEDDHGRHGENEPGDDHGGHGDDD